MVWVIYFIIVIITFIIWKYLNVDKNLVILGNKIPGPPGCPLIGNTFSLPRNGAEALKKREQWVKEYGHISRLWFGNTLCVILSDPKDCEIILKDSKQIEKSVLYKFLHPWLGTGLLTSTGEKWHIRRKAITPAFHFSILENFVNVFNKNGDILINCLKKHCEGIEENIQPFLTRYTLDVICETAMGTEVNAQSGQNANYVAAVKRMCKITADRMRRPLLQFLYYLVGPLFEERKLLNILHSHTNKVIEEKKKQLTSQINTQESDNNEEGVKKRVAFLELLLKMRISGNSAFQSDDDIREEVDTFMFEGHDTTTAGIGFALVLLSKHKEIQEKIYKEQLELSEQSKDNYYEKLQNMKYLECVIKECLRLYPSVPAVGRQITRDVQLPSGYTLPAGCFLIMSVFFMHRNENYFPNPDVFNPDNFLLENSVNRHPYAYIPFSAGPRNCIGQKFAMLEMKSVLSKIILNFIIEPAAGWEVIVDPNMVLHSLNGFKFKLISRKS